MAEETTSPVYVIGAIDGKTGTDVMDINPIVKGSWKLNNGVIENGEELYSSSSVAQACIDYMATVPFMYIGTETPNNHHIGLWINTGQPVEERQYEPPTPQ